MTWTDTLTDAQRKEIAWSRLYAKEHAHGTTGHNALLLIAKLASLLDATESGLRLANLRVPSNEALHVAANMVVDAWRRQDEPTAFEDALAALAVCVRGPARPAEPLDTTDPISAIVAWSKVDPAQEAP